METFRVHDEGVWALTADEEFEVFYSGGRDRQVCATELTDGELRGRTRVGEIDSWSTRNKLFYSLCTSVI